MIPPVLVLVVVGRGPWLVPVPIPVVLLWPLALLVLGYGLIARDTRGAALIRVFAASRGLRISMRGQAGERLLVRVL